MFYIIIVIDTAAVNPGFPAHQSGAALAAANLLKKDAETTSYKKAGETSVDETR
jgi:hypothetical protein